MSSDTGHYNRLNKNGTLRRINTIFKQSSLSCNSPHPTTKQLRNFLSVKVKGKTVFVNPMKAERKTVGEDPFTLKVEARLMW